VTVDLITETTTKRLTCGQHIQHGLLDKGVIEFLAGWSRIVNDFTLIIDSGMQFKS
jgi:hypothetical protein